MTRLLLLCLWPLAAMADDPTVKLRLLPEWHAERTDSAFASAGDTTGLGRDRLTAEAEIRATRHGVNLVATGRTSKREGANRDDELVLNELYYETTVAGQRVGGGKKIFGWDVGFGFRPLDVIQQENRRALFVTTLEGIPYLSWERFGSRDAWTLVIANPGRGMASEVQNEESVALKYYLRGDATDWHAVARLSRRHHWEAGAAVSRVVGDGGEMHLSALYQRAYQQQVNVLAGQQAIVLAEADPTRTLNLAHGVKALTGFTLTGASGWSLLGEAWYDQSAYTTGYWRALAALTRTQASLLDVPGIPAQAVRGNIGWSARAFESPVLLRQNVLMRVSHRGESGEIEPALDVLLTPADGGWVATLSASREGNRVRMDAGLRVFGGPRDSAYRLLPEKHIAYLSLQVSF